MSRAKAKLGRFLLRIPCRDASDLWCNFSLRFAVVPWKSPIFSPPMWNMRSHQWLPIFWLGSRSSHQQKAALKTKASRVMVQGLPKLLTWEVTSYRSNIRAISAGRNGGFLSHRGTPGSHHPFRTMGFSRSQKPSSYGSVPPWTSCEMIPVLFSSMAVKFHPLIMMLIPISAHQKRKRHPVFPNWRNACKYPNICIWPTFFKLPFEEGNKTFSTQTQLEPRKKHWTPEPVWRSNL